ncbi:hypothetical protein GS506_24770 [Rhodococcus hoagii]|nr:hypothetical protein [Prescottella equi]
MFTSITVITLAVISSLLPDICHAQSKIGRRFKVLSFFIRLLFGHRTFTHSLLFFNYNLFIICYSNANLLFNYDYIRNAVSCYTRYVNTWGVKFLYPIPISVNSL